MPARKTHGLSKTPEYRSWNSLIQRTTNPRCHAYASYGGRGITVCPAWRHDFLAFLADMGPRPTPKHSIDRIDNNGSYEPANCRWATAKQQCRNTRTNHNVTIAGEQLCMSAWAEKYGIDRSLIYQRMKVGWSIADAITRPPGPSGRHGETITCNGITKTITEWAEHLDIPPNTLHSRIHRGVEFHDAIRMPVVHALNTNMSKESLIGHVFGALTVVSEQPKKPKSPNTVWRCECVCGTEIDVFGHNLKAGRSKSCGCMRKHPSPTTRANRVMGQQKRWQRYWDERNASDPVSPT